MRRAHPSPPSNLVLSRASTKRGRGNLRTPALRATRKANQSAAPASKGPLGAAWGAGRDDPKTRGRNNETRESEGRGPPHWRRRCGRRAMRGCGGAE